MKVLFVGPSLAGVDITGLVAAAPTASLLVRGPARQGDIARAVIDGATAVGLVDGLFETVAAVWHKEILFALSEGVRVFGAASMGALRAAECAPFGMTGIGAIYRRYASGEFDDDAAVAHLHAPAELGFAPLTEALVNVEATLAHATRQGLVTPAEAAGLGACAARVYFKDRTWDRLVSAVEEIPEQRRTEIRSSIAEFRVDAKRRDAEELLMHLIAAPEERTLHCPFDLSRTDMLERTIHQIEHSRSIV